MGMYTQFIIEVKLKTETPSEIIECLQDMISDIDNSLFIFQRNPLNNYCGSNEYPKSFNNLILKAHGEIKNYWGDIEKFIEFIKPYVSEGYLENGAYAKSLYEESLEWKYFKI